MQRVSEEEVRAAMKRMMSGKATGPDDAPVELWRYPGDRSHRGKNMMSYMIKLWERVKLRREVIVSEQQTGFMPKKMQCLL